MIKGFSKIQVITKECKDSDKKNVKTKINKNKLSIKLNRPKVIDFGYDGCGAHTHQW